MLLDFIATITAGVGLAGVVMVIRHLSRGGLPKWTLPAAIGAGMLMFSVWNEYSWYPRVTAALPAEVIVLSSPAEQVIYRPWTYVFPLHKRFMALDRTVMQKSTENPAVRRAEVMVVQRWTATQRIPLAFDCDRGLNADLLDGTVLAPDGTLTGGRWQEVGKEDELQRAACQEG